METVADAIDLNVHVVAEYGPFALTETGIVEPDEPASIEEWLAATAWVQLVEKASPWWTARLLQYGERYGELAAQALGDVGGLDDQTCANRLSVAKAFPPERVRPSVSFSHHAELVPLPVAEQEEWLDKLESATASGSPISRDQLRVRLQVAKAQGTGQVVEFWVSVQLKTIEEQATFADEQRNAGRAVKLSNSSKKADA